MPNKNMFNFEVEDTAVAIQANDTDWNKQSVSTSQVWKSSGLLVFKNCQTNLIKSKNMYNMKLWELSKNAADTQKSLNAVLDIWQCSC